MEVVIHGTKGGYRILYKTPGAPSIGNDIRNNVSSEAALGKSAYSIAFAANGCVFTKYIIIRDTLRNDATGFIAFSLFLSLNKELLNGGADVKAILDELSNQYVDKYVRNNSINKGETEIIQEDLSFVDNILARKTEQNRSHYDVEIQPGTKEAAFVFYENEVELQEYFSKPFQGEYNGYKQILLINGGLHNRSDDLLQTLRNSGEELKVDLRNDPFYLSNYNPIRGLSITSSGKLRSDRRKSNVIRAKERVEIKYTKEYHKSIEVEGTLSNPNSDIFQYLDIKGNQIIIKWNELSSDLKPYKKTINFDIRDWGRKSVNDVEITCHNNSDSKIVTNNKITFEGDDLGKRWRVSAKNDSFYSENKIIDFEEDCPDTSSVVDIILNKHRLIIIVHEDSLQGDIITNGINVNKTEFTDSELEGEHKINVSCRGYKSYSFNYSPIKNKSPKHIYLQKELFTNISKTSDSYSVNPGKHGTLKGGNGYMSNTKDGSDVKNIIIPNKGYKFTNFRQEGSTLVAEYIKKKYFFQNEKFIAAIMVAAVFIIIGFLYLLGENKWSIKRLISQFSQDQEKTNKLNTQRIQDYIEGDSLILGTLESYKKLVDEGHMQMLDSLNSAIKKRTYVDNFNFAELKKLFYYPSQKLFEAAVAKVDSSQYKQIPSKFADVSSWSLTQIADSLKTFLDHKQAVKNSTKVEKEIENENKHGAKKEDVQLIEPETEKKTDSPPTNYNNTTEIIQYLKSNELRNDVLEKYLKDAGSNAALKKSIKLCLEFWELDGSQNKSYSSFLQKVKSDINLKNSKLRSFVENMSSKQNPKYLPELPGIKVISTLKQIQDKIE